MTQKFSVVLVFFPMACSVLISSLSHRVFSFIGSTITLLNALLFSQEIFFTINTCTLLKD